MRKLLRIESIGLLFVWAFISFPLFGQRFIPTHDGEYHLIRIHEFSTMLRDGNLFPRWAPGLNSGYGFPLFIFHYPFPNYVGSFFHLLGAPLVQSFQLSIALGTLIACIGCYIFLKKESESRVIPFLGTILFLTIPYLYVDMYVRGSVGEIWGIAFSWCALASTVWGRKTLLAISLALLILSHNIIAMIMIPIIIGYTFLFYKKNFPYVVLGILLASYFWLPALLESKYVVGLNSVTYTDHFPTLIQLLFPSWGTVFSQPGMVAGEISQQIGIIPLFVLFFSVVFAIKHSWKNKKLLYFILITIISLFLLLSMSGPIWELFPFLQYLQYPWRLLSILLITVPVMFSYLIRNWKPVFQYGFVLLAILLSFSYFRPVTYEPRSDIYYLSRKEFTDGTSSLGNSFSTIWTPWIKERPVENVQLREGKGRIYNQDTSSTSVSFTLDSETPAAIRINRTYYPGWNVSYNATYVPIEYNSNGIIDIHLPSGSGKVVARFGETRERIFANIISILALSSLLLFSILSRRYAHRN